MKMNDKRRLTTLTNLGIRGKLTDEEEIEFNALFNAKIKSKHTVIDRPTKKMGLSFGTSGKI